MHVNDYRIRAQKDAQCRAFLARDHVAFAHHSNTRFDARSAAHKQREAAEAALLAQLAYLGLCWEECWKYTGSLDGVLLAPPDIRY